MKEKNVVNLLKRVIEIVAVATLIICIFGIPFVANYAAGSMPQYAIYKNQIMIFVYVTVIPFYFGLYNVYKLCNLINKGESFSNKSIEILKNISMLAFLEIILYLLGSIIMLAFKAVAFSYLLIMCVVIFFATLISVFSLVLINLFKSAMKIKEENELTI